MKKKDILQSNISCEFSNLCESLLSELNQSTINSALLKYSKAEDRNPIAKAGSARFAKLAYNQGERKGLMIRTVPGFYDLEAQKINDDRFNADHLYRNYYIESGSRRTDFDNNIKMKAVRDSHKRHTGGGLTPSKHSPKREEVELVYNIFENTLHEYSDDSPQLYLASKADAQNLAKAIKQYTGVTVSWKSMDFS